MTYNVFSGTLNPTQSISYASRNSQSSGWQPSIFVYKAQEPAACCRLVAPTINAMRITKTITADHCARLLDAKSTVFRRSTSHFQSKVVSS